MADAPVSWFFLNMMLRVPDGKLLKGTSKNSLSKRYMAWYNKDSQKRWPV